MADQLEMAWSSPTPTGSWSSTATAQNVPSVLAYPPDRAPEAVWKDAFEEAVAKNPNPLTEDQRRSILAEETRAWCFGFAVATALQVTKPDEFIDEANAGLGWYYLRLRLPNMSAWATTTCTCGFTAEEQRHISDLTDPPAPGT